MTRRALILTLLTPVGAACAAKRRTPQRPDRYVQRGLASWYGHGDGYDGRRTASGERFDKHKLTAAHATLPFGTRIRVTHLRNRRSVDVKINDRFVIGKPTSSRILDLSYGAAKRLRMVDEGVAQIEFTVLA
jgi:peptidoglycan lytic transglycosylase